MQMFRVFNCSFSFSRLTVSMLLSSLCDDGHCYVVIARAESYETDGRLRRCRNDLPSRKHARTLNRLFSPSVL